jgi:hypothetical protein
MADATLVINFSVASTFGIITIKVIDDNTKFANEIAKIKTASIFFLIIFLRSYDYYSCL